MKGYCEHGFPTCAICNPPKPYHWTPATQAQAIAYAERCAKRKAWLKEQLRTRPTAYAPTRRAWRAELKQLG